MKNLAKPGIAAGLIAAAALMPATAVAGTGPAVLTFYTQAVDGETAAYSVDYFASNGYPNPGASFVQGSELYLNANRTGPSVGTAYIACTQMIAPTDVQCVATFKLKDGAVTLAGGAVAAKSSINVAGFYTEAEGVTAPCLPNTNVLSVTGGTGAAFTGSQGQLTIVHSGEDPDPGNSCTHTHHNFKFVLTLLPNPNGQMYSVAAP
jgi:hypothetical protein